jgi:hypothetical protein
MVFWGRLFELSEVQQTMAVAAGREAPPPQRFNAGQTDPPDRGHGLGLISV